MKKTLLFAAVICLAAAFTGCKDTKIPTNDTTKLWVAPNADWTQVGYIDAKGNFAIPATYQAAYDFCCGYACVVVGNRVQFIDKNNKLQTSAPAMDDCDVNFYHNCLGYKISNLWGMVDTHFKTVIQPANYYLGYMSKDGLALVQRTSSSKLGYMDRSGKVAIAEMYDGASMFIDGVAVVRMGNYYGAIDKKGQFVINPTYDYLKSVGGGRIAFNEKGSDKGGLLDLKGNVVVAAMYDDFDPVGFTTSNLMVAERNNSFSFYDKNGNLAFPGNYISCSSFYDGVAWVLISEDSNWQLIDTKGKVLFSLDSNQEPYTIFHNGLAQIVTVGSNSATLEFIDKSKNVVYSCSVSASDLAPARVKGQLDKTRLYAGTEAAMMVNPKEVNMDR
ncbi:MAG: WG repeat-containing protein [Paludibacteraceae bacterium]|nr:WG repeat-containing protein [Paludibacteraceae bacterium]